MSPVLLDLHAAAAAVPSLAARQILVDVVFREREAGRYAVDDGGQGLPVRLPRGEKTERHSPIILLARR